MWAAAEWIMMICNMFAREEDDDLILLSGIPPAWLEPGPAEMGPIHTRFGPVSVRAETVAKGIRVTWRSAWREVPSRLLIKIPAQEPAVVHKPEETDEFIVAQR